MNQQRTRIVVGVDGSPGSRAALEYALRDAARRDAAVEVVAACAPPEYWMPLSGSPDTSRMDDIREAVRQNTTETVRAVTDQLEDALPQMPPVTITAVTGGPADALLRAANGADLLVVGSRGHGGFSSILLGSVSLQCTLHAPCPVTVVRPIATEKAEAPAVAEPAPATG
jgi:nucleotide-binding universal stress UspA family protein